MDIKKVKGISWDRINFYKIYSKQFGLMEKGYLKDAKKGRFETCIVSNIKDNVIIFNDEFNYLKKSK